MLVKHVMSAEVVTFPPSALCRDVLDVFRQKRIRHAPVLEGETLVGVVAERDLVRKLPSSVAELESEAGAAAARATLAEVMAPRPETCAVNEAVDEVARRMLARRLGCFPVVDGGKLVGIVTTVDVLRGLATVAGEPGEHRLVLMRLPRAKESETPAALCLGLGLELRTLRTYRAQNGVDYFLLGLRCSDAELEHFVRVAVRAGHLFLDGRPDDARRAG